MRRFKPVFGRNKARRRHDTSRHVRKNPRKWPVRGADSPQNSQKWPKRGGGNGEFDSVPRGLNAHASGTLFAAKGPWPPTPPEKLRQSRIVVLTVSRNAAERFLLIGRLWRGVAPTRPDPTTHLVPRISARSRPHRRAST